MTGQKILAAAQMERIFSYLRNVDGVSDKEALSFFKGADLGAPNQLYRDELYEIMLAVRPHLLTQKESEADSERSADDG